MPLLNDNSLQQKRVKLLQVLVYGAFFVLGCQLWRLQILYGEHYHQAAERNRIRVLPIPAPRGIIRDREGRPLVSNRPAFNVVLTRENLRDLDRTLDFVERYLDLDREALLARIRKFDKTPLFQPIIIKEDVSWSDLGTVESHAREHPELTISQEPRRLYPFQSLAAHVLGYVGEIGERQIGGDEFPDSRPGDLIGRQGIERVYNATLTGQDGERRVMVNSLGKVIKELEKKDAVPGQEVRLSLDLDLQLVAEKRMEGHVGALIAMDPHSGEILAMVSRPAFDPNSFMGRISSEDWQELVRDPASPFMNRAIQGTYSPGSIFKIIMALAGLEQGTIRRADWIFCNGQVDLFNHTFRCSHRGGHGFVNVNLAIQNSCNVFFYLMGKEMGIDTIARYARRLGFGRKTEVDLPSERAGLVPDPQWKQQRYGRKWYTGETVSVSIGQGALSVTPLQLVKAIGEVATGVGSIRPHLRMDVPPVAQGELTVSDREYDPEYREILREAMWRVVNSSGTGQMAAVSGMEVCGKTGTVQVIGRERKAELAQEDGVASVSQYQDHAWFVGFAPRSSPEIAISVFVENGGQGGTTAAPIAAEVIREYFAKKGMYPRADPRVAGLQKSRATTP